MNRIAIFAIALAGAIHVVLAPQHYAHAPAHGIFFLLAGVAEIAWAVAFLDKPTKSNYYLGLALSGGLIVLWGITRIFPAPFHDQSEIVEISGIVCKLSELIGIGALLALAAQGGILGLGKQTFVRLAAVAILVATAAGLSSYGAGLAAEPLFPSLFGNEHHDEDHPHEDGEHDEIHEHSE